MKSLRHENIYEDIGEFGPYQMVLFFLVGLLAVQPSLTGYGFVFIGATPDHQYINNYIFLEIISLSYQVAKAILSHKIC